MRKKKITHQEKDQLLSIRLDKDTVEHLDVEVAELQKKHPGAIWTRSGLVRKLVLEGLARMVGAKPR
jgi:hypothetical protein